MRGSGRIGRGALGDPAGDRIERGTAAPRTTWDTVLVWFMRVTALLWLAKGVHAWATILDLVPGPRSFEAEPVGRQAVIVYLAVIDLTAAVGLWLTSAWGGVIWLLAATSALTLATLTPQLLPTPLPVVIVQASIVAVYFVLSWFAAREGR
ncbi:DUF6163 family protein [Methylobacterium durans]|uniref:DUF6163 family protein n=1 Tax=Methylobacterium durans TaxID=2202825 RepID=UPI002AFE65DD|nr:DUF6163 family protein [Methylobacterium durans]MEA1831525.1 DUF6163 family protein [Methylobacterium durans]